MRHHRPLAVIALAVALAACNHAEPPPVPAPASGWQLEWADGTVFYEIFVRSFADSNGDGIGDFRGLTAKLDYLNDGNPATSDDLGIAGIWLMPVFSSPSYHGYDVVDYRAIEADYGTMEDFHAFLDAAHARGIKVVIDLMINHTSSQHPWFAESASSPESPKREWYVWRPDNPGWTQPWGIYPTWHEKNGAYYYGIFWGGMPDLNFANPEVVAEVNNIASFWLEQGVDGFRLDAARHIVADGPGELQNDTPETHAFGKRFSAHVRSVAPQALLIGENWTTTEKIAPYFGSTATVARGDELPMSFDFPLGEAILEAVTTGDGRSVAETLAEMAHAYPIGVLDGTFLTNHDMPRVATQLDADASRLRAAAAILLTLPGSPFVYYGEELGMVGNKPDEDIRPPMPWSDEGEGAGFTTGTPWHPFAPGRETANVARERGGSLLVHFQRGNSDSLLDHYRRLIHLRNTAPALRLGTVEVLGPTDARMPVLAYVRTRGADRVLVAHNLTSEERSAGPWPIGANTPELIWSDGSRATATVGERGVSVILPPGASAIWRLP